jgi:hypothetical protein
VNESKEVRRSACYAGYVQTVEDTYLEQVDAALGCAEVLLEREDVVLEAVALFLGGKELEAEGAVGDGEAQGAVDGIAHVLLGAGGERRNPTLHLRRRRSSGSHRSGDLPWPPPRERKDGRTDEGSLLGREGKEEEAI